MNLLVGSSDQNSADNVAESRRIYVVALERPLFGGGAKQFRTRGIDYISIKSVTEVLKCLSSDRQPSVLLIDVESLAATPHQLNRLIDASRQCSVPVILKDKKIARPVSEKDSSGYTSMVVPSLIPFDHLVHALHSIAATSVKCGRKSPRVRLNFSAVVSIENDVKPAIMKDLSASGALVFGGGVVQAGSEIDLSFELPRNKKVLSISCVVARVFESGSGENSVGLGLRFVKFEGDSGRRIDRFVTRSLERDVDQFLFRPLNVRSERK